MERTFRSTNPAPGGEFHRGVSAILRSGGRVLLVHRAPDRDWAPNTWDVPGGHVEGSESEVDAVIREMREELGVEIHPYAPECRLEGPNFAVAYFTIDSWAGTPVNSAPEEHVDIRWFTSLELADLVLADENLLPILLSALR
jgi:8-oxo-dGTP diphosphatase